MKRIQRNHVKAGANIRVTWEVGSFALVAAGTVEEKPHRFDEEPRVRLKLAPRGPNEVEREVWVLGPEGHMVSLQGEGGVGWDGWLVVPDDAKYFPLDS